MPCCRVHVVIVAALRPRIGSCRELGRLDSRLHLLSAFAYVAGIVLFWVLIVAIRSCDTPGDTIRHGAGRQRRKSGRRCVGAGGTIVFGIWLAFSYGGYDIWDGWIIAAHRPLGVAAATGSATPANEYMKGMPKAQELEAAGQTEPEHRAPWPQPHLARGLLLHAAGSVIVLCAHRHDLEARAHDRSPRSVRRLELPALPARARRDGPRRRDADRRLSARLRPRR